jgi:hypothetical protein
MASFSSITRRYNPIEVASRNTETAKLSDALKAQIIPQRKGRNSRETRSLLSILLGLW